MLPYLAFFPRGLTSKPLFLLLCLALAGCSPVQAAAGPVLQPSPPPSTAAPAQNLPTPAPALPTVAPTAVSTPAAAPAYLDATLWESEPLVPIILYHRFIPDFNKESSKTKIRLGDFLQHLQSLYDAGYSLVPLKNWLKGDLTVPAGRRPLILTFDDAFFADQIFLAPDGTPSPKSGIGVLWQFSREHPDFGFSAALFSNLGDKLYANLDAGSSFVNEGPWKPALANAIVWGIQHDVMPYNHLYTHPRLDLTQGNQIVSEIQDNDKFLAKLLVLVQQEQLLPSIDNIIALPYSIWPPNPIGKKLLINYHNPLGQPVLAVLEAGYYHDTNTLAYSPFSSHFQRYHIPRITMNTQKALNYLVDHRQQVPVAQSCRLGPVDPARAADPAYLSGLVKDAVQSALCPHAYYSVSGFYFDASGQTVIQGQLAPIGE